MMNKAKDLFIYAIAIIVLISALISIIFLPVYTYKKYQVWGASISGQAQLAQAEYNRQILVKEAEAKAAAAISLAKAEVERAHGVAQANKIIGASLENNEAYLRYLWVNNLQNEHNQVIYVPTEANLPILEANRLGHLKK